MSRILALRRFIMRRVWLFAIVGFLVISMGAVVALQVGHSAPASQAAHKQVSKSTPKTQTVSPPASTPPPPDATPTTVASNPTPTPVKPKPSPTQAAPAASGYPWGACTQMVTNLYPSYNAEIKVEYAKHQQLLAELQQAYDNGEYYDPGTGDLGYNDYQADVQDENDRFNQATLAIQNKYNAQLSAAGCYLSRI